jgi:hypothetical protein
VSLGRIQIPSANVVLKDSGSEMYRYLIVHPELGILLGSSLGLGFWSKKDPAGLDRAVTFESDVDARAYIQSWADQSWSDEIRFVGVEADIEDRYASLDACVKVGFDSWAPGSKFGAVEVPFGDPCSAVRPLTDFEFEKAYEPYRANYRLVHRIRELVQDAALSAEASVSMFEGLSAYYDRLHEYERKVLREHERLVRMWADIVILHAGIYLLHEVAYLDREAIDPFEYPSLEPLELYENLGLSQEEFLSWTQTGSLPVEYLERVGLVMEKCYGEASS